MNNNKNWKDICFIPNIMIFAICRNEPLVATARDSQSKQVRNFYHWKLLQACKSTYNRTDHSRKCGLQLFKQLDYYIQISKFYLDRQWYAIHHQIISQASHTHLHKSPDHMRISPRRKPFKRNGTVAQLWRLFAAKVSITNATGIYLFGRWPTRRSDLLRISSLTHFNLF